MRFSTGHRPGPARGRPHGHGVARRHSAELARAIVVAIDTASATVDDVARARAFERAMHDTQAVVRSLAAERQRAVLAALADGASLDTIAVQLGTDRRGIQSIVDGHNSEARAEFEQSAPVRWG